MDANGFFCYDDRKQRNPTMFQYIHAEVYARKACTNPKNKTKYCIDDIIGEVIRDPAHSEAIANPQPPRYIISSEAGLKGHANEKKKTQPIIAIKWVGKCEDAPVLVAGVASFPREIAEKRPRPLCAVGIANSCLSPRKIRR